MLKSLLTGASLSVLLVAGASAQTAGSFQPSPERIEAHMAYLASDQLGGREAGTVAFDMAARYVADEFRKLGLKPAGDDGTFLQRVPLVAYRSAGPGEFSLTGADGTRTPLVHGVDYTPGGSPEASTVVQDAPLVFAGQGVVAGGRDDYAGLDVRGKIVVLLPGAPASLNTEEGAHSRSGLTKRKLAAARGAVGVLQLETPAGRKARPFTATPAQGMTWRTPEGRLPDSGAPSLGGLSLEGAAKVFAGAPTSLDAVMTALAADTPQRGFDLPGRMSVRLANEVRTLQSSNVAGLIEGSDLKNEVIVLSAHLDGLGIHDAAGTDRIHNGAMDNASGVSTLLEVGRAFKEPGRRPRRSVLLLAVTAEEKGLIGADYFANNPTMPKSRLAANVNLDMPILSYDFSDVVAFGAERSTIGQAAARAAARAGVRLVPDHRPEMGLFVRSDHYRFVEQGVPAVFLMTGPGNGGDEAWDKFFAERYHKPSDDIGQPIRYDTAAKFALVNFEIASELANMPERPRWNTGDFFGDLFTRSSVPAGTSTGGR